MLEIEKLAVEEKKLRVAQRAMEHRSIHNSVKQKKATKQNKAAQE